jgi:F-type H+-transporting ATPase subunit b
MDLITPGIGLVFWTTLVFVILLFLLVKFAWKPIVGALKTREESIKDALQAADIAKLEMEELQSSNQKLLDQAKVERAKLIDEARAAAKAIVGEATSKASSEAQSIITKAHAAIEGEKKSALAEIKELASVLSVDIAEKLLRKELSDKAAQEQLIESYIKEANFTL